MVQRKKKPDKLIAGFLALLTAFSPVVSVVPVYASSTEDGYGSSITMDPDSIQIDGQDDGIVIDSSGDDASGITVIGEDDNGSEGDGGIQIDGEDSGDSGDGIQIDEEEPDDGIDIGETEPDDGISISDEDITIVDVDPWEGISDVEDFSSDEYTSDVPNMCEFDIDLRSVHGYVKLTSNDDSDDVKFIRVAESEDGYKAVVRNIDDEIIYDNRLDDTAGIPWSEFVLSGKTYDVEVTADEGYVVTGFDIVRFADNNSNDETDFLPGVNTYLCNVMLDSDKSLVVNFGLAKDVDFFVSDELTDGLTDIADGSDVLIDVDTEIEEDSVSSNVFLESEKDALGYENISVLDSMQDDVDIPDITIEDEREAYGDPVYEKYIRDNLNADYTEFDTLIPVGSLLLKQTFFDQALVGNLKTIDAVMNLDDEDKSSVLLGQMDTMLPVFETESNSDYYVAYVDTMHNDSRSYVMDASFALNDLDGNSLLDCVYDYHTGIAYIPKHYFYNENDEFVMNRVQVQLGQVIDYNPQYTESVVLDSSNGNVGVNSSDIFLGDCDVYVDPGLDSDHMDVYVNGAPAFCEYTYDPDDGHISLGMSSALVSSVYVKDTRNAAQMIMNFIFPVTVAHALTDEQMEYVGTVTVKDGESVNVGDGGLEKGTYWYIGSSSSSLNFSKYSHSCYTFQAGSIGNDPESQKWVNWIVKGGGNPPTPLDVDVTTNGLFFCVDLDTITTKNLPFEFDNLIDNNATLIAPFQCCHISQPAAGGTEVTIKGKRGYKGANIYTRVISKYTDGKWTYFTLGICTGKHYSNQTGVGLIKLRYKDGPVTKKVKIHKQLSQAYREFDTTGLEAYDLNGTWFSVYKSKEAAENATVIHDIGTTTKDLDKPGSRGCLHTFKVKNDDGDTGVWSLTYKDGKWYDKDDNVIPDKVYVVETKAGKGYKLPYDKESGTAKAVEIDLNSGDSTIVVNYSNMPVRDPGRLTLFKVPNVNDEMLNITDIDKFKSLCDSEMNGAEFTLEYWGRTPEEGSDNYRTWADKIINGYVDKSDKPGEGDPSGFETEETVKYKPDTTIKLKSVNHPLYGNGAVTIDEYCIVSGDWPYVWSYGDKLNYVMPIGLYRLTETKAPEGYELPEQTEFLGVTVQHYREAIDNFGGKFHWLDNGRNVISESQMKAEYTDPKTGDSYKGSISLLNERSGYVNLGVLKIDAATGKPGKPNDNALSLAGIEFSIWYDESNVETLDNQITGEKVEPGDQIKGITLVTDENGCADTVGLNIKNGKDKGVLVPGRKYILKETKPNDSFFLNKTEFPFEIPEDIDSEWRPSDAPACLFPMTDGSVIAHKDIKSAKELYDDYIKNKGDASKCKIDVDSVIKVPDVSPKIGVGVSKFDLMRDSSELGPDGKANHGNATLEGHTYVVLNGTKSEVRLNDKKMTDGKGTKIKSIWEHGDHLKNPYNPTYKELYHYAEESDFQVDVDGNGYICAVLVTDKDGNAETAPDLLPMGVYYVIEVDTKVTDEGYHDYLVNTLDVGHVGEYEPGPEETDEDGKKKDTDKYVLKRADGEEANASNMSPDGEVFQAEFTQDLKKKLYPDEDKELADKKQPADMPPRGGVEFQKYNYIILPTYDLCQNI